jgi:hypothetical protein
MRLESLCHDVAFACRSYRRQPGVALTALVTLTLGIGACCPRAQLAGSTPSWRYAPSNAFLRKSSREPRKVICRRVV